MLKHSITACAAFITISFSWAQPSNDDCANALRLCANQTLQGTTTGATTNASEDNNFCSVSSSTVWFMFTTNASGGNVTIDFTNLSFNIDPSYGQSIDAVIFDVGTACDQTTYTPNSSCGNSGTDFSITSAIALNPNTTYFVMVNGSNSGVGVTEPAECDFDISISGPAIDATYPIASISANDTVLCQGDDEVITTTISNCADTASFDWYYDNVLIESGATNQFSTTNLTNSGWLKLIINCGTLCVYSDTTDSIYFDVTPIGADAGSDKFIQNGDVVTLDGSGSGNPDWTPGTTLTDPSIFQPTASPSQTTTYFLTVTNGSCIATDSVNVFVGQVVIIYSSFSPNGDNINDKWVITNSAQYPDMEVTIYDRSGQKVFNTTGYSTQDKWWDGTYKNQPLPVSTYFYVVDLKIGDEGIFKGPVSIIR